MRLRINNLPQPYKDNDINQSAGDIPLQVPRTSKVARWQKQLIPITSKVNEIQQSKMNQTCTAASEKSWHHQSSATGEFRPQ